MHQGSHAFYDKRKLVDLARGNGQTADQQMIPRWWSIRFGACPLCVLTKRRYRSYQLRGSLANHKALHRA
ncbi:hypothetical protein [Hydrogenophaga sp.]|uniref:hypothetical protein n=1 Tax=Hydrogenophaga sp. TaxID=1904254 RepID=UPI003D0EB689